MRIENQSTEQAIIHLKTGNRKYGILLFQKNINDNYHFISNTNYPLFNKTGNTIFIEILPRNVIESIETDLK
jgi:hypothetical protein